MSEDFKGICIYVFSMIGIAMPVLAFWEYTPIGVAYVIVCSACWYYSIEDTKNYFALPLFPLILGIPTLYCLTEDYLFRSLAFVIYGTACFTALLFRGKKSSH